MDPGLDGTGPERTAKQRGLGLVIALLALASVFALGRATGQHPVADDHALEVAHDGPSAVDVGFVHDMIAHHQQALVMADIVGMRGAPRLRALADVIRSGQLEEIGQMRGLLLAWGEPLVGSTQPMAWMHPSGGAADGGGHEHGAADHDQMSSNAMHQSGMPGMATQDQLRDLQSARGRGLSDLFLNLMSRHHQAAVVMADTAVRTGSSPVVRAMAQRMSYEQLEEIAIMSTWGRQP